MLETLVLILALTTIVLGNLVRTLFQKNTQLRSDLESRLHAIEKVEGPFARELAEAGPAPLKRALKLNIQIYAKFWKDVLQLTPVQVEEIKTQLYNLKKEASTEAYDKNPLNIMVRIEEWRGGYTHFRVQYPLCPLYPLEKPKASSRYDGRQDENLWQFEIPRQEGEWLSGWLWLESNGQVVRLLYVPASRLGSSFMGSEPAPDNVFLAIPLGEGPPAERYFKPAFVKPAFRFKYAPHTYLQPWERYYQHSDVQKGLGWELWIEDCDLRTRAKENGPNAVDQMLADWSERFARNDDGKAWHGRVANAIKDRYTQERAELEYRLSGPQEDAEPASHPGMMEQE